MSHLHHPSNVLVALKPSIKFDPPSFYVTSCICRMDFGLKSWDHPGTSSSFKVSSPKSGHSTFILDNPKRIYSAPKTLLDFFQNLKTDEKKNSFDSSFLFSLVSRWQKNLLTHVADFFFTTNNETRNFSTETKFRLFR